VKRALAVAVVAVTATGCSGESSREPRAWLGIQMRPITPVAACFFHLPVTHGLIVARVFPHSAAWRAGLVAPEKPTLVVGDPWPIGGDIIVRADGRPVATGAQLSKVTETKRRGELVTLTIYRRRTKRTIAVELGRPPTGNVVSVDHGVMVGAAERSEREMRSQGC
jgi:S1-C subfamily serine protease